MDAVQKHRRLRQLTLAMAFLLVACAGPSPVTAADVVGTYRNGTGYVITLQQGGSYEAVDAQGQRVERGEWTLEPGGQRISLRRCRVVAPAERADRGCLEFSGYTVNTVIAHLGDEVIIGTGEPPEDDYRRVLRAR